MANTVYGGRVPSSSDILDNPLWADIIRLGGGNPMRPAVNRARSGRIPPALHGGQSSDDGLGIEGPLAQARQADDMAMMMNMMAADQNTARAEGLRSQVPAERQYADMYRAVQDWDPSKTPADIQLGQSLGTLGPEAEERKARQSLGEQEIAQRREASLLDATAGRNMLGAGTGAGNFADTILRGVAEKAGYNLPAPAKPLGQQLAEKAAADEAAKKKAAVPVNQQPAGEYGVLPSIWDAGADAINWIGEDLPEAVFGSGFMQSEERRVAQNREKAKAFWDSMIGSMTN
jgi:hypothetical protein